MRRFVLAVVLTSILSVPAFAGDIPIIPGPSQPTGTTQTTSIATVVLTLISLLYR